MNEFLTSIGSNLQAYDPEEHRNKRPALSFGWAKTGAAMALVHSVGQKDFVIHIGVEMHMTTPQVAAQIFIQALLHQVSFPAHLVRSEFSNILA